MIVQGENDPRVRASEAEQMVQAAKKRGNTGLVPVSEERRHDFGQKALDSNCMKLCSSSRSSS